MATTTVCILHPGEMGAEVGRAARAGGARVLWVSAGPRRRHARPRRGGGPRGRRLARKRRSPSRASCSRSARPMPHSDACGERRSAADSAACTWTRTPCRRRPRAGSAGSSKRPARPSSMAGSSDRRRRRAGTTRLYLSGPASAEVAALFAGSPLGTVVLDAPVGAASAVKACYAAWTKGAAPLLTVRSRARAPRGRRGDARRGMEDLPAESLRAARPRSLRTPARAGAGSAKWRRSARRSTRRAFPTVSPWRRRKCAAGSSRSKTRAA